MRVLIITQHFPPEVTAASFRLGPIAEALAAAGHETDVVSAMPNHPAGVIARQFRGRSLVRQRRTRLRVRYVWVYSRPRKTLRTRLLSYGSFAAGGALVGLARRKVDVVLASSPPLSVGAAGAALATRHGCPFVFDVRDLWPQSALDLGELREGRALEAARRLERWLYRRANAVLTPNQAFARTIESSGAPAPIAVVPNGTTSEWLGVGTRHVTRQELDLPQDSFVWAYAGNLGLAHAVEDAVDAATLLGDGFRLVIVGDGPRRQALEERAANQVAAGSIEFRDLMPPQEAARHLRAANAVLVAERQAQTVSAKLYDCCAVGRPLVAVCTGELERLVRSEQLGLTVPPGQPGALARAIKRIRDDPDSARSSVDRARAYAETHLRELQAARVVAILEDLAG